MRMHEILSQRDEVDNGLLEQRQTANLVGNVRRFTVALSRAQCMLVVIGSPEVHCRLDTTMVNLL